MRLANGIVLDKEKTFGALKFSALRHEVRVENEDGTTSEEIKRRTYDLKCSQQERTIQVSIPAEIPVKDYPGKRQLPRGRRGMVHQGRRHCTEK